ncbi:MAG: UvrB/UvrC motif-containing protein, partial [Frankia sp.]
LQPCGRPAGKGRGRVHISGESSTPSWAKAIDETNRRREKQVAYNTERGLDPQPLRKKVVDILDDLIREDAEGELIGGGGRSQSRGKAPVPGMSSRGRGRDDVIGRHAADLAGMPRSELAQLIRQLDDQMHEAAKELQFELAARLRDEVGELKKELRGMEAANVS